MEATLKFINDISVFAQRRAYLYGVALIIFLAMPVMRVHLESSLIHHMFIQIPLLVLAGCLIGKNTLIFKLQMWNNGGIPGVLIAVFGLFFWMIPRWLDAALSEPLWEVIKFITVPLFIGIPLGISWPRMSSFSRAVVWTNAISMLVVIGWLYVAAPVRICNNYLVNQQEDFGYTSMTLALVIALYWTGTLFFGSWKKEQH